VQRRIQHRVQRTTWQLVDSTAYPQSWMRVCKSKCMCIRLDCYMYVHQDVRTQHTCKYVVY